MNIHTFSVPASTLGVSLVGEGNYFAIDDGDKTALIPVWSSRNQWRNAATAALKDPDIEAVRAGNSVSRETYLAIVDVVASAADHATGRDMTFSCAKIGALAAQRTAWTVRTQGRRGAYDRKQVQRAFRVLVAAGLIVETGRGRYLTASERTAVKAATGRDLAKLPSRRTLTVPRRWANQPNTPPARPRTRSKGPQPNTEKVALSVKNTFQEISSVLKVANLVNKNAIFTKSDRSCGTKQAASRPVRLKTKRKVRQQRPFSPETITFANALLERMPWIESKWAICRILAAGNIAEKGWTPGSFMQELDWRIKQLDIRVPAPSEQTNPIAFFNWLITNTRMKTATPRTPSRPSTPPVVSNCAAGEHAWLGFTDATRGPAKACRHCDAIQWNESTIVSISPC